MFFQRYLDHHELQKCELCRDSWGVTSCYFIVFPDQTPALLFTNKWLYRGMLTLSHSFDGSSRSLREGLGVGLDLDDRSDGQKAE